MGHKYSHGVLEFLLRGLPLPDSTALTKAIFFSSTVKKIHCTAWVFLVIPPYVILLIINQMLLIEADTGLLNGLVLDLLNFKE